MRVDIKLLILSFSPSILDHSCMPSAVYTFVGNTIFIKAIKDVPTDDVKELRISYIDELESTEDRQRQLRSAYYFECDCKRCVSETLFLG